MTREQALAFVEACIGSPKVKAHLGAALGYGGIPTMDDWGYSNPEAVENCEDLTAYFGEVYATLRAIQDNREKQSEVPGTERRRPAKVEEA